MHPLLYMYGSVHNSRNGHRCSDTLKEKGNLFFLCPRINACFDRSESDTCIEKSYCSKVTFWGDIQRPRFGFPFIAIDVEME